MCAEKSAFDLLRVIKNEVFMVENGRWAHFAVMVLALLAVATVAGYFPAWKPSKVDPDSVLRGE